MATLIWATALLVPAMEEQLVPQAVVSETALACTLMQERLQVAGIVEWEQVVAATATALLSYPVKGAACTRREVSLAAAGI
jgi:hypothetical protein